MNLKEKKRWFRAWQKEPPRYMVKSKGLNHCANCGHEFEGNYCPVCRQEAGDGRITWDWVRQSIMNLWGMDSRSMPYSLFQLLLRPGYFIGDYISGRRQVSYPPVSMLFGMAVVYAIIEQLLGLNNTTSSTPTPEGLNYIEGAVNWLSENPAWSMLSLTMVMFLPTWALFRYSPRHPRHTLPEGFFIQLFMAILLLIFSLLSDISNWFILLFPLYYYFAYRQLFGYRFWGTFWRLFVCLFVWINIILCIGTGLILIGVNTKVHDGTIEALIIVIIVLLALTASILTIGHLIGRRTEKRRIKQTNNQP